MAFQEEPTRTPASIGTIQVILSDDFDGQGDPFQAAYFDIEVILSDGSKRTRRGDLASHITVAQRQGLMSFMDALRTQAEQQIL
jgi:hypothetical protein